MTEPATEPVVEPGLPATLGGRLDEQARRMAARLLPAFGWAGPLAVVTRRALDLAATGSGRFDRTEVRPGRPVMVRAPGSADRPGAGPAPVRMPPAPGAAADGSAEPPGLQGAPDAETPPGRPPPRRVPDGVRARLREIAGPGADAMMVRTDPPAAALARAHRADAVTVGREVHLGAGRYRPHDPHGFALLAHEATHVSALLRPDAAWRRATGTGRAEEEAAAGAAEHTALFGPPPHTAGPHPAGPFPHPAGTAVGPSARAAPPAAAPPAPAAPAAAGPAHPMPARTDRDAAAPPSAPVDVAALRRDLLADLRRQLRTEFERGG